MKCVFLWWTTSFFCKHNPTFKWLKTSIVANLRAKKTGPRRKSMFGRRRAEMLKSPKKLFQGIHWKLQIKNSTVQERLRFDFHLCAPDAGGAHPSTNTPAQPPPVGVLAGGSFRFISTREVSSHRLLTSECLSKFVKGVFSPQNPPRVSPHTAPPPPPTPECYCICSTEETHKHKHTQHNRAVC